MTLKRRGTFLNLKHLEVDNFEAKSCQVEAFKLKLIKLTLSKVKL